MTSTTLMKKIMFIMLFTLLLAGTMYIPKTFAADTNGVAIDGALSVLYEENSMHAYLFATGVETSSLLTVELQTNTGEVFVLPLTQIDDKLWEARFPISAESANMTAYYDGKEITTTSTTKPSEEERRVHEKTGGLPKEEKEKPKTLPNTNITNTSTPLKTYALSKERLQLVDKPLGLKIQSKERTGTKEEPVQARETKDGLIIEPQTTAIKRIELRGLDKNLQGKQLRIGTPTITDTRLSDIIQSYAIDPEELNFTNGTISVNAKGRQLYKCAEWNFSTEICEGEWLFQQNIKPGETYNITFTAKDPAYAEMTILAMEWGIITNLNDTWQTINTTYSYANPVIIVTPEYNSTTQDPVVSRITNVSARGFETKLQLAANSGVTPTNKAYYLVIEEGNWTLPDGRRIEAYNYDSTTTDNDADWSPETQSYQNSYTTPNVYAQVMSYNDSLWSVAWSSDGSQLDPANAAGLAIGKHVGEDPITSRSTEIIGYVVVEEGTGTLNGVTYDTFISSDSIRGMGNSPPYTASFNAGFTSAPEVLIVTMAAMDGANGGWAVAYEGTTSTDASIVCDEDIVGDTDRVHTTEQVYVFAFESEGSYLANDPPVISKPNLSVTQAEPTETVVFNVSIDDAQGESTVTYANATLVYPNMSSVNISLTQVAAGQSNTSGDQETGTANIVAQEKQIVGETGLLSSVSTWQTVSFDNTYTTPYVFAFTRNQSDINTTVEQALAIIRNVTTTSFEVAVILPDNSFSTDDVGYIVMEEGSHNISGTIVQAGSWSYSGAVYTTKTFDEAFSSVPTVYFQIQDNANHWYTGRYDDTSRGTTSIDIQYEDNTNSFSGSATVAYLGFEEGANNANYEGDIETNVGEDAPAQWHALSFINSHSTPLFFAHLSDPGGDPAKVGTGSLTSNGLNVRVTEDTFSDPEQVHSTDEVMWMVFNASQNLADDNSQTDIDADKNGTLYEDVTNAGMTIISSITIRVNITDYNTSGSQANGNANPTLELYVESGSGLVSAGEKAILGTGEISWNIIDNDILTAWRTTTNRDIQIRAKKFDYNSASNVDSISWNNVTIELSGGDPTSTWRTPISTTSDIGLYNITRIYTSDGIENSTANYTSLTFTISDTTPPTFTYIINQTFGITQEVNVTFTAEDYSGISMWTQNDSRFSITDGTLINTSTLTEGIYIMNISVNDTYNNINWKIIQVNMTSVADTTPPQFTPPLENQTINYGESLYYDINATDDRGRLGSFSVNDSAFAIDAVSGVLTNASELTNALYWLNITINDTSGNKNSEQITITQIDTRPPIINTSNTTAEYDQDFIYKINASDNLAIDNYWLTATSDFSINNTGYIHNTTSLIRNNIYLFYVNVNDTNNNTAQQLLQVKVVDTTPPSTITGLSMQSRGKSWISWTWTNPSEADFAQVLLYLNGISHENISDSNINITGLRPGTSYTVSTQTKDNDNNINTTWINITTNTLNNIAPSIFITSPQNTSNISTNYANFTLSFTDPDDTNVCLRVYGARSNPTTNNLIYKNCSMHNATATNFTWKTLPLTITAQTSVLYHFDNETGENDSYVDNIASTVNELSCTTNCPQYTDEGILGGSRSYNGVNQYFALDESYFNAAFSERTFEAWIKPNSTSGIHYVYEEGGATNGNAVRIEDGRLYYATRTGGIQYTISTSYTDTNNWHYMVAGYNNGNMTLYLDGILVNTTDTSVDYTTIAGHGNFGGIGYRQSSDAFGGTTNGDYYAGHIDEIRITDVAPNTTDIALNAALNNSYEWYAKINDTLTTNTTGTNTLTIDITTPTSTLFLPIDNDHRDTTTNIEVNFTCNASDNYALANMTLYLTNASNESFSANKTISISGTQNSTLFTTSLVSGDYTWACQAQDIVGNKDFSENRTLTVYYIEYNAPQIQILSPLGGTYNVTQNITIQANISEDTLLDWKYANITLDNGTIYQTNLTWQTGELYEANYTLPIHNGTYNISIIANDTFGNQNSTWTTINVSYGGLLSIGESQDPVANLMPFIVWADYEYDDGSDILGASCEVLALNQTIISYHQEGYDDIETYRDANHHDAVVLENVNNYTWNTNFTLSFDLGYNGSENKNFSIWLRNESTLSSWNTSQKPDFVINKTTHPEINETLQKIKIQVPDSYFSEYGNHTVFFTCEDCNTTEYYMLGEDEDNFGHSYEFLGPETLTWDNRTEQLVEYMVEISVDHKPISLYYNASESRYEHSASVYFTKASNFTYKWKANCTKEGHTALEEYTTLTVLNNAIPEVNITNLSSNTLEIGESLPIGWTNNQNGNAFGIIKSYINLSYENGTYIEQFLGSSFTIDASYFDQVGNYTLTAYAENDLGSNSSQENISVVDTTSPNIILLESPGLLIANGSTINITANITDNGTISIVNASINWTSGSSYVLLTDHDSDGTYNASFSITSIPGRYNISINATDTSNNTNITTSYFISHERPRMKVLWPLDEVFDKCGEVHYAVNITSPYTITNLITNVTRPDHTHAIMPMSPALITDTFSSDNGQWSQQGLTTGTQVCEVDINSTVSGSAYTRLSGTSTYTGYTTCGLGSISTKHVVGNFDINITFNTSEIKEAMGIVLSVSEEQTMTNDDRFSVARMYSSTYGQDIMFFSVKDGTVNFSLLSGVTITKGMLRIKRWGNNFSAWYDDGTLTYLGSKIVNLSNVLHVQYGIMAEPLASDDMNVSFSELNISDQSGLWSGVCTGADIEGQYNVSYIAEDNYSIQSLAYNTTFNITEINDPPGTPLILDPDPDEVVSGTINITWLKVEDDENDTLVYDIELLDSDDAYVDTIVSDLPNLPYPRTSYLFDTTVYTDDTYKIKVIVRENETAELYHNNDTLKGVIHINNTLPSLIGTNETIQTNAQNINVSVGGQEANYTKTYVGTQIIRITMNNGPSISFEHDFIKRLNLSNITTNIYANGSMSAKVPGKENITFRVPLNGSICDVLICEGALNESECTPQTRSYQYPSIDNGYCPILVNGTYAKDRPDFTDFIAENINIPNNIYEGANVSFNVTVYNNGTTWADNVTVLVRDEITNTLIENYTIGNFTNKTQVNISTWYIFSRGPHNISLKIDPNDTFGEYNESNNNISTWANVSAWQTIYGSIFEELTLAGETNTFYTWPKTNVTNANIYAVDADATITWADLQALTRDINNNSASEDFGEADIALGMTGYSDSITARFGSDNSTPLATTSFTIYNKLVSNIPIIDSTTTSSFQTGILWDTSDDTGDSEYSGTESLLFMTKASADTLGTYGTYDYELTIPSALQETEGTSDVTYLYVELT